MNRRNFFGALLIAPVVGVAVIKRAMEGEKPPLVSNREQFYGELKAAWYGHGEYKDIARRLGR